MSESLAVQVNARWRVVVVSGLAWRRRAWMIQQLIGDIWQDRAVLRTAVSLRAYLKLHAGR